MFVFKVVLFIVAMIVLARSIKIIREDQRAVVFRLGRLLTVLGPGVNFIIPIVDKIQRVDLKKSIPQWRSLSPTELEAEVRAVVLGESKAQPAAQSSIR